jgi:hypothetical protein
LDIYSSRYDSFTESLKLDFVQKIQIYLSLVYIILDNIEICFLCFREQMAARGGRGRGRGRGGSNPPITMEKLMNTQNQMMQMFMQHMQNNPLQEDRHMFM